jgi:hypothetical protein
MNKSLPRVPTTPRRIITWVTETIGDCPETYVEIAVRLGLAPAYRQQLSRKIVAANYHWWYLPETLVCYRRHGESATEYFAQTQQQQAQILRAIEISKSYLTANLREILTDRAKQNYGLDGAQTFQP